MSNTLNLSETMIWDVYDAQTAERLLHNATIDDIETLLAGRTDPVTVEPVGGHVRRPEHVQQPESD